ncbi:MAG: porin [Proteobacteria bacterium]|nr:MAG: porin [Pseudomonadota bacterium]
MISKRFAMTLLLLSAGVGSADDDRDASLFEIQGSVDFEYSRDRVDFDSPAPSASFSDSLLTVQLELDGAVDSGTGAHLLIELQSEEDEESAIDEAFVYVEFDRWQVVAGRQYLPFGRFDSLFGTDSFTEFAEIRATALLAQWKFSPLWRIDTFVLDGKIDTRGKPDADFGLGVERSARDESWSVGFGYIGDLAEARDSILDRDIRVTARRVAGWNLHASATLGDVGLLLETMTALGRFAELDADFDRPSAATVELTHFLSRRLSYAVRVESSRELEDAPRRRYGVSLQWQPLDQFGIGADFLIGRFGPGRSIDEDDDVNRTRQFFIEFSLDF